MNKPNQTWAVYGITKHGLKVCEQLKRSLKDTDLYVSEKLIPTSTDVECIPLIIPMRQTISKIFTQYNVHVFILSIGAVVRMIAPLLKSKYQDPAVICIDDKGQFVIPILSGHVGGGNEAARRIAKILNARVVITTASDVQETLTVDILGRELGWVLDDPKRNVTKGCAAVVNQNPVLIIQESGESQFWSLDHPLPKGVSYTASFKNVNTKAYEIILVITDRDIRKKHPEIYKRAIIYRPKSLVLGLGCDRNVPLQLVRRGIQKVCAGYKLDIRCISAIYSITQKADEIAFLDIAKQYAWPFHTFSASHINQIKSIPNPSKTVEKVLGVCGVAEPCAILGAKGTIKDLIVPKQIYKEHGCQQSMTIAVARIPFQMR